MKSLMGFLVNPTGSHHFWVGTQAWRTLNVTVPAQTDMISCITACLLLVFICSSLEDYEWCCWNLFHHEFGGIKTNKNRVIQRELKCTRNQCCCTSCDQNGKDMLLHGGYGEVPQAYINSSWPVGPANDQSHEDDSSLTLKNSTEWKKTSDFRDIQQASVEKDMSWGIETLTSQDKFRMRGNSSKALHIEKSDPGEPVICCGTKVNITGNNIMENT